MSRNLLQTFDGFVLFDLFVVHFYFKETNIFVLQSIFNSFINKS